MTPAVRFDKVSKRFNLDIARPRSFQEMFVQRRIRAEADAFWAIQDVSFTIEPGEHVGLVGTNGSGKSTLLKLMSRVLEPTSGKIEMHGRVAGLLELGTGFHPDLTGRENIFLNASILGLPRAEIKRRLDDIIDFADIGPFIDVQVRNYSSGMVVRLGFAITTALVPEVLLIDEVLAVGDADFQRKCIARLEDLQAEGVTLVFVSHGMAQVQQLCQRAIWISHGRVVADGEVESVAGHYMDSVAPASTKRHAPQVESADPIGGALTKPRLRGWNCKMPPENVRRISRPATFSACGCTIRPTRASSSPRLAWPFIATMACTSTAPTPSARAFTSTPLKGAATPITSSNSLPLNPGAYELTVAIYDRNSKLAYDHQHRAVSLEVRATGLWSEAGVVHIPASWQHVPLDAQAEA